MNSVLFGKILKKIKIRNDLKYKIVQFTSNRKINDKELYCNNVKSLEENLKIQNIIILENEFNKFNDLIKEKLQFINDKIVKKVDGKIIYILLCEIDIDPNAIQQFNINSNIDRFAKEIEREIFKNKSKEYNLIVNYE